MTDWTSLKKGECLPCIVCDKELETWAGAANQPTYGLAFQSDGHYPSPVFDAMGKGFIELSICEDCLLAKASRQIAYVPRSPQSEVLMTVATLRECIKDLRDDSTFNEISFTQGGMVSRGLNDPSSIIHFDELFFLTDVEWSTHTDAELEEAFYGRVDDDAHNCPDDVA